MRLLGIALLATLALATPAQAECVSIQALLAETQRKFPDVSIVRELTGMEAHAFAAMASKQTGHDFDADEVGFMTSHAMAPSLLAIFATKGCAHDAVTFTPNRGGDNA